MQSPAMCGLIQKICRWLPLSLALTFERKQLVGMDAPFHSRTSQDSLHHRTQSALQFHSSGTEGTSLGASAHLGYSLRHDHHSHAFALTECLKMPGETWISLDAPGRDNKPSETLAEIQLNYCSWLLKTAQRGLTVLDIAQKAFWDEKVRKVWKTKS